ncbi:MAG: hypothetical protein AMXMBFR84_09960 [Candidatus Hydrogenedentota bacterium]
MSSLAFRLACTVTAALLLCVGCTVDVISETTTPILAYEIVKTYPHDRGAFTQGLDYVDGFFYEGTGIYGHSTLRKVDPATGTSTQRINLPSHHFGEGIVVAGDRIIQLTWQTEAGFVYDKDSFALENTFSYKHEGWGITFDGTHLIVSDGSWRLRFWDPQTFEETAVIEVKDGNRPIQNLNELEYVNGSVFANVWKTDAICRIDPKTGQVTGWIDLKGILTQDDLAQPVDVLNGIAYNDSADTFFITGKLWPKVFEIRLAPES